MRALEFLDELRKREVKAPVIILADDADIPSAVRAVKAGAVDFLEKPFIQRHLLQRIREILDASGVPGAASQAVTGRKER